MYSQVIFSLSYIMSTRANKVWVPTYCLLWLTEYSKETFLGIYKVNLILSIRMQAWKQK